MSAANGFMQTVAWLVLAMDIKTSVYVYGSFPLLSHPEAGTVWALSIFHFPFSLFKTSIEQKGRNNLQKRKRKAAKGAYEIDRIATCRRVVNETTSSNL